MINDTPNPKRESHKRESTDDRRVAIAMAARALIIEKGFEGLRTRDIADRVGINIATMHYHVPTKEALIDMVAQTIRTEFKAQSQRRPRVDLPALEVLRMEFEDFRETLVDAPDTAIIFSELLNRARRHPQVEDAVSPMQTHWIGQFRTLLAKGVAEGSFRANLDPASAALMITGALTDFWQRTPSDLPAFDRLALELERAVITPHTADKESSK